MLQEQLFYNDVHKTVTYKPIPLAFSSNCETLGSMSTSGLLRMWSEFPPAPELGELVISTTGMHLLQFNFTIKARKHKKDGCVRGNIHTMISEERKDI